MKLGEQLRIGYDDHAWDIVDKINKALEEHGLAFVPDETEHDGFGLWTLTRVNTKLVVIESPFGTNLDGSRATADQIETNIRYVRACMADCLRRNEAPYASHAIYTLPGVLNDALPEERKKGMEAGFAWGAKADLVAVYCDLEITSGMSAGIERAKANGIPCEERHLDGEWGVEGASRRSDQFGRLGG
jgi:hypothetical protein